MKFIHQDCDASLAEDRTLPYTAYLVEYIQDGITKFDIVTAPKQVEILITTGITIEMISLT